MIRILVADDHPVVRAGLRRLMEDHADLRVAAEAVDGHEVLERVGEVEVDLVLLDINMPGPGFLKVLQQLKEQHPGLPVLVLSVHLEEEYALRVLKAGAAGFLSKDTPGRELVNAIRRVAGGDRYITPGLALELASLVVSGARPPAHESLWDREFQVLCRTAEGKKLKEIAMELSVKPKTVSTYRRRLMVKLGLSSQAEAIRYAIQAGLVD